VSIKPGDFQSALIGMLFAGLFFFLIIAIPTICLVDMGRHGDTLRRQRVIPLLIGIPILAVGYVFYVLGVGCALAGECM
jgi:hypothetical protein